MFKLQWTLRTLKSYLSFHREKETEFQKAVACHGSHLINKIVLSRTQFLESTFFLARSIWMKNLSFGESSGQKFPVLMSLWSCSQTRLVNKINQTKTISKKTDPVGVHRSFGLKYAHHKSHCIYLGQRSKLTLSPQR